MTEDKRESAPLTIRLFGPIDVRVDGSSIRPLRSRKGYWLLALLLLRNGRPVERNWIAAVLWPESDDRRSLANLRLCLTDLKSALGKESHRILHPTPRSLAFDVTHAQVDVIAFDQYVMNGGIAEQQKAVALYRGPLLEKCEEDWVTAERVHRENVVIQVLERLASNALGRQNAASAVAYLRQATSIDPLRETMHCALFAALFAAGDATAATVAYRNFRQHLHRALNAEPSPETRALFQRLRSQHHSGVRMSGPVISPINRAIRHLPAHQTRLIGRQSQIDAVTQLLYHHPLITLTGTGGIGKTRLSIAVADAAADGYPHGIWFIDLASLTKSDDVALAVSSVLGIREESNQDHSETLKNYLRDREALLILDNCEHLVDASARLAAWLLEHCPNLKILATSRQRLGLSVEHVFPVPALSLPEKHRLLPPPPDIVSALMESDAIQLFADRADAASPGFQIKPELAANVSSLCAMLDGIPFAIELSAAWVRVLPVDQILARMENRFSLLTGGKRGSHSRQQTLRATLDWSYDLLRWDARVLLRRLSVFIGGWTLEAAEAVCGDNDSSSPRVLDVMADLIDWSLVLYSEASGYPRYSLLETTRQYAAELLKESGEEATVRAKYLRYYIELSSKAVLMQADADLSRWILGINPDYENLRAALNRCHEDFEHSSACLLLSGLLSHIWERRGHYREGIAALTTALARDDRILGTPAKAIALTGLGRLKAMQFDFQAARDLHQQACEVWRGIGDENSIAEPLRGLGNAYLFLSEYETAKSYLEQALVIDRRNGNRAGEVKDLSNLGIAAKNQGDYTRAQTVFLQALTVAEGLDDPLLAGRIFHNLGIIAREQKDFDLARKHYDRSLAIHRDVGNTTWIGNNLSELGYLALETGDTTTARHMFNQSLEMSRDNGTPFITAVCLAGLGDVEQHEGDESICRRLRVEVLQIFHKLRVKREVVLSIRGVATTEAFYGNWGRATRLMAASLSLREQLSLPISPPGSGLPDALLSSARRSLGDATFEKLWSEGKAMSEDEAVIYACEPV